MGQGLTQRRACTLISDIRSCLVFECTIPSKDGHVMAAKSEFSALYLRYGACRIRVFFQRDGMVMGRDRASLEKLIDIFEPVGFRDNGSSHLRSSDEASEIYGRADRSNIARGG
jgi:hypothetical protein